MTPDLSLKLSAPCAVALLEAARAGGRLRAAFDVGPAATHVAIERVIGGAQGTVVLSLTVHATHRRDAQVLRGDLPWQLDARWALVDGALALVLGAPRPHHTTGATLTAWGDQIAHPHLAEHLADALAAWAGALPVWVPGSPPAARLALDGDTLHVLAEAPGRTRPSAPPIPTAPDGASSDATLSMSGAGVRRLLAALVGAELSGWSARAAAGGVSVRADGGAALVALGGPRELGAVVPVGADGEAVASVLRARLRDVGLPRPGVFQLTVAAARVDALHDLAHVLSLEAAAVQGDARDGVVVDLRAVARRVRVPSAATLLGAVRGGGQMVALAYEARGERIVVPLDRARSAVAAGALAPTRLPLGQGPVALREGPLTAEDMATLAGWGLVTP